MKGVRIVEVLDLPDQTIDAKELYSKFSHLQHLPIDSFESGSPKLLIGLKHAHLGAPINVPLYPGSGPIPIMTKLGCIIYGSNDCNLVSEVDDNVRRVLFTNVPDLGELHEMIKHHYSIEDFGVKSVPQVESAEDKRALQILEMTTNRVEGHFISGLLWRNDDVVLPSSYQMAATYRFLAIERKMMKDDSFAKLYHQTINNYIQKGYARKLSYEESQRTTEKTWYLPHFGVTNPNKPDKFRLVFDGAAMAEGTSLNSNLLVGPDLNQPLLKILWKFRERQIGVCGDICEMYHQVKIRDEDQSSQRFLWRELPNGPIEKYQMMAMTFGSSSSPTTAQFVKNKNAMEFSELYPLAAKAIIDCHYVDDYVCCYSTEDEAIRITKDVIRIHKKGGFHLRNFISNSKIVASSLNGGCNSIDNVSMDISSENHVDKVLGLFWKVDQDVFTFQLKFSRIAKDIISLERSPTKRELLAIAMSIYDPFGFISNFTIYIKILIQKVWKEGMAWDDPIPDHINDQWKQWFEELENIKQVSIPRCYSPHLFNCSKVELHTMVDASSVAFSAVSYLRICYTGGVQVALVASKTKCAPIKELSIPRLELHSAVLGTRLSQTIAESHSIQIHQTYY